MRKKETKNFENNLSSNFNEENYLDLNENKNEINNQQNENRKPNFNSSLLIKRNRNEDNPEEKEILQNDKQFGNNKEKNFIDKDKTSFNESITSDDTLNNNIGESDKKKEIEKEKEKFLKHSQRKRKIKYYK